MYASISGKLPNLASFKLFIENVKYFFLFYYNIFLHNLYVVWVYFAVALLIKIPKQLQLIASSTYFDLFNINVIKFIGNSFDSNVIGSII